MWLEAVINVFPLKTVCVNPGFRSRTPWVPTILPLGQWHAPPPDELTSDVHGMLAMGPPRELSHWATSESLSSLYSMMS